MPLVALCADEASMAHPELIGLADEQLFAQPWLRLFTSGSEIRTFLRHDRAVDEVWVVSCDDIEPINLAATIKGDRGDVRVCLVSFQGTGSIRWIRRTPGPPCPFRAIIFPRCFFCFSCLWGSPALPL